MYPCFGWSVSTSPLCTPAASASSSAWHICKTTHLWIVCQLTNHCGSFGFNIAWAYWTLTSRIPVTSEVLKEHLSRKCDMKLVIKEIHHMTAYDITMKHVFCCLFEVFILIHESVVIFQDRPGSSLLLHLTTTWDGLRCGLLRSGTTLLPRRRSCTW